MIRLHYLIIAAGDSTNECNYFALHHHIYRYTTASIEPMKNKMKQFFFLIHSVGPSHVVVMIFVTLAKIQKSSFVFLVTVWCVFAQAKSTVHS